MNREPFSSTADETRVYEDDPESTQMSVGGRESDIKGKMKPERDGLGKDIRAWRRRRRSPYERPPHPREQRPIKPARIASAQTFRVPISEDKDQRVLVRSFNGIIYVNIRGFFRQPGTQKWICGKRGIDMPLKRWEALKDASPKIDGAIQMLKDKINNSP